jgi:hypothetical protein
MIDAKQAVQLAMGKAYEMLGAEPWSLEELERESYRDHEVWSITLGHPRDADRLAALGQLGSIIHGSIEYKRFLIDVETGDLLAMKLREVAVS